MIGHLVLPDIHFNHQLARVRRKSTESGTHPGAMRQGIHPPPKGVWYAGGFAQKAPSRAVTRRPGRQRALLFSAGTHEGPLRLPIPLREPRRRPERTLYPELII